MRYQRSSELFAEAKKYIPGGVNSPVRAFKAVGGEPIFIKEAKGAYLKDEDGNTYIDYISSWGPLLFGHAHAPVIKAVVEKAEKGTSFGIPTEIETELARLAVKMVPNIDKIRFVNSGTEACMSAVRLARGYTSKDKIIKFAGCYHGHSDAFLIQAGSGAVTFGSPNSPGVTQGTAKDTLLANYNDLEGVKELVAANTGEIAAIILEPIAGNMGCIIPTDEFIQGLRELCTQEGILLLFDEVMTGFRLAKGGAQEVLGIDADIVMFGKVIGGGLPVGAFAARAEIMSHLAPEGPVYQAGTLKGITHQINRYGSMISVHFCEAPVYDFASSAKGNNDTFKKYFHGMLDHGIYLPPSAFESYFLNDAISYADLDKTIEAVS